MRENLSRSNHPEKTSPTCRPSTNYNAEITEGKLNPNTSVNSGQDMESGLSVISRKPADPQPIRKHKTCPFPSCKVILKQPVTTAVLSFQTCEDRTWAIINYNTKKINLNDLTVGFQRDFCLPLSSFWFGCHYSP